MKREEIEAELKVLYGAPPLGELQEIMSKINFLEPLRFKDITDKDVIEYLELSKSYCEHISKAHIDLYNIKLFSERIAGITL